MKVFVDYELNNSGKGKFLKRLIPALAKIGVKCYFKPQGCDVALGISKWRNLPRMPRVLRVDGIHLRKGKKETWRNEQIRKSIKGSDLVIFQSIYARDTVIKKLTVVPQKTEVIFNGANPEDYIVKPALLYGKPNVLLVARWGEKRERKDKHLGWHLKIANEMPHTHFWLIGALPYKVEPRSNLTIVGELKEEELRKYLVAADALLYLAHPDWCPNTVIEALVAGLPVVGIKGSGVEEVLCAGKWGGFVAKDLKQVPVGLDYAISNKATVCREDLYIDNIAQKYKRAFERIC
jgi:glycosyltransferase involved in cell wall biosynthesis